MNTWDSNGISTHASQALPTEQQSHTLGAGQIWGYLFPVEKYDNNLWWHKSWLPVITTKKINNLIPIMLILYPIRQQALSFTTYQWNHIIQQWLTSEANVIEKKNPVSFFCKMRFIQQSWRELPFWETQVLSPLWSAKVIIFKHTLKLYYTT